MRAPIVTLLLLAAHAAAADNALFDPSDRCMACHNGLTAPSGEDISIGFDWRPGMMANSARDPYWQAGVRREILDHPGARAAIEGECSICHMPMARYESRAAGREGQIFALLSPGPAVPAAVRAADGVSCSLCHQISPDKFGSRESFVGHFAIGGNGTVRPAYGPFAVDAGRSRVMRSSSGFTPTEAKHIRQSELCATCHTLYTKALGPQGQVIGELPEQVPYLEWLHSAYAAQQGCPDCHMPRVAGPAAISSVLAQPREGVARHTFPGGNFLVPRILNRFRQELSVAAPPQELEASALRAAAHLQSEAARISIHGAAWRDGRLVAEVAVENLAGHKLPTAYPSRRVWLRFVVRDGGGRVVFESGALEPSGAIRGNDNDADPARYEPHYLEITSPGEVQVYESVMADSAGAPTTGLLSGVRYLKDNRVLPHGFDKLTASRDIAVAGRASDDPDFTAGGDRVRYAVALARDSGPYEIEAELWYQPVSFRWAANLRRYDAQETRRFARYYDSMARASAVLLSRCAASVP